MARVSQESAVYEQKETTDRGMVGVKCENRDISETLGTQENRAREACVGEYENASSSFFIRFLNDASVRGTR